MRQASCRSCGAAIIWASTAKNGTPIPLDAAPNEAGNVVLAEEKHGPVATTLGPLEVAIAQEATRYMPHHATCPQGKDWRR